MVNRVVRVAVADDHPVIRLGVEALIRETPTFEYAGSASNSEELFRLLDEQLCEVLVTDYAMPGGVHGDGLMLIAKLRHRHPELALVVLSGVIVPAVVAALSAQDVGAIVSKADDLGHVAAAIQAVSVGRNYLSPSIASMTKDGSGTGTIAKLSPRELEVLSLYIGGATINEIADRLNVRKQTVSTQKLNGMRKLGLDSEADLFKQASDLGLTPTRL